MTTASEARTKTKKYEESIAKDELLDIEESINESAEMGLRFVCRSQITEEAQRVLIGLGYTIRTENPIPAWGAYYLIEW